MGYGDEDNGVKVGGEVAFIVYGPIIIYMDTYVHMYIHACKVYVTMGAFGGGFQRRGEGGAARQSSCLVILVLVLYSLHTRIGNILHVVHMYICTELKEIIDAYSFLR